MSFWMGYPYEVDLSVSLGSFCNYWVESRSERLVDLVSSLETKIRNRVIAVGLRRKLKLGVGGLPMVVWSRTQRRRESERKWVSVRVRESVIEWACVCPERRPLSQVVPYTWRIAKKMENKGNEFSPIGVDQGTRDTSRRHNGQDHLTDLVKMDSRDSICSPRCQDSPTIKSVLCRV